MLKKHLKTTIAIILAVMISVMTLAPFAEVAAEEQPAADGKSKTPSGLAYSAIEGEFDKLIKKNIDDTAAVGMIFFDKEQEIASKYFGEINPEGELKADEDTIWEWGSISKLLVWVSVMQLVEDDQIDLASDIRNYLPDHFTKKLNKCLKYNEPVTMLNLMNHNAGFQDTAASFMVKAGKKLPTLEEALIDSMPLQINRPGEIAAYSNFSAALAGYIVEEISGQSYADYVEEHIFAPLGIENSFASVDGSDKPEISKRRDKVNSYVALAGYKKNQGNQRYHITIYPCGSATGTLSDLAKFAQALLKGSPASEKIFKNPATLDKMLEPSLYYGDSDVPRISHGLMHLTGSVPYLGHSGNTLGFSSNLVIDQQSGTGVVISTNKYAEGTYNAGIPDLLYGKLTLEKMQDLYGEEDFAKLDLSGFFCSDRYNFKNTPVKMRGFLNTLLTGCLPISKGGDEKFSIAGVSHITQLGANWAEMHTAALGDESEKPADEIGVQAMYIKSDGGNQVEKYEMPMGLDYKRQSEADFKAQVIIFAIFAILNIYTLVLLLIHLISYNKAKKSDLKEQRKLQIFAESTAFIAFIIVWIMVFNGDLTRVMLSTCSIIVLILAAASSFFIFKIFKLRKSNAPFSGPAPQPQILPNASPAVPGEYAPAPGCSTNFSGVVPEASAEALAADQLNKAEQASENTKEQSAVPMPQASTAQAPMPNLPFYAPPEEIEKMHLKNRRKASRSFVYSCVITGLLIFNIIYWQVYIFYF